MTNTMVDSLDAGSGWLISVVTLAITTTFLYKLTVWFWRHKQLLAIYEKLPGKKETHWFWGHLHEHPGPGEDGIEFQMWYCRNYPRLHKIWYGNVMCIVLLHHPDTVRPVLNSSSAIAQKSRGPGTVYEIGIPWLGEGLLIANGQKWARNRKLLTPAFHYEILQPYLKTVNKCTDIFLEKLEGFASNNSSFEVFEHICLCSLDIITQCAFSYKADCQTQGEKHPYVQAVLRLQELWIQRSLNPALIFDWFYFNFTSNGREFARHCHFVHKVAEDIIRKRRITLESEGLPSQEENNSKKRSLDFLDIILTARDDDGKGLTDLEIRNEVDTFLFEGHDTTTSATSFILLSLAQHPDIQEMCRQEVDGILGNRENDDVEWLVVVVNPFPHNKILDWSKMKEAADDNIKGDLNSFPYLTQCIKEGLRLHSPVFFMQRKVTEEIMIGGYQIPANTNIAMNIYNLHHNPEVWGDDAEEFKPERFSIENCAKMHPYQFIPFSAGHRNCIGQNFAMNEIKVIVARTLHRYKLSVKPGHVIKKRMGILMRTENGAMLNVEPRLRN